MPNRDISRQNLAENFYDSEPDLGESSTSLRLRPPWAVHEHDAGDGSEENVFRDMTFEEILEDLNARFLVNLPREEMSLVRVYWQAEQA